MKFRTKLRQFVISCKQLTGTPNYIAMGMAAGIFVCATPTFPFQTFIAIAIAFILRGSKPAAAMGSWIGAPLIPVFYLGAYKTGMFFVGGQLSCETGMPPISELFKMGGKVACAMLTGGIVIGIPAGIIAYFITLKLFTAIRLKQKRENKI